ncbi:hypothetical protein B0H11DRAFT_2269180 [Mycena galericulata]|nr:hypothetical protein B0H11DRAFT_2269180 [Mycena galericulata]
MIIGAARPTSLLVPLRNRIGMPTTAVVARYVPTLTVLLLAASAATSKSASGVSELHFHFHWPIYTSTDSLPLPLLWYILASAFATATATASSGSSNPGALSNCALACISTAAADSSCLVATNLTCVCTDANFQAMSASCLAAECQPAEVGPALALQEQECGTSAFFFLLIRYALPATPRTSLLFHPSLANADPRRLTASPTAAPTATAPFIPFSPAADISASVTGSASASASTAPTSTAPFTPSNPAEDISASVTSSDASRLDSFFLFSFFRFFVLSFVSLLSFTSSLPRFVIMSSVPRRMRVRLFRFSTGAAIASFCLLPTPFPYPASRSTVPRSHARPSILPFAPLSISSPTRSPFPLLLPSFFPFPFLFLVPSSLLSDHSPQAPPNPRTAWARVARWERASPSRAAAAPSSRRWFCGDALCKMVVL